MITPLGTYCLVKPVQAEKVSPSGIILQDTSKTTRAEVLARGSEVGGISIGDVVGFPKTAGQKHDDGLLIKEEDIWWKE